MEIVKVQEINITNITSSELNHHIKMSCDDNRKELILNVNVHAMNIAYEQKWFKDLLNGAYINFCDGDGVRIGAKILGKNIIEKITYNRWIWELAEYSSKNGLSWYTVGSEQHVMEKAIAVMREQFPDLKIVGHHHGYLSNKETEKDLVIDIKKKSPNILILGMGMPLQEKWIRKNIRELNFNVALTGGATFEYIAGTAKMTPDIFYRLKLEWFYRFIKDPKRLFKRYFIGNPLFFWRIFREKINS
ncbi:WecB/TagA/CpsF family glycosyltransferase [Reichenbachiella sp.]|uniref:WecB/TagA/CpsF family glycosyltransferase n=1 Tax=Reichenbachiella sp. TaxID=2184521 RepID=UPI003BAE33D3